MSENRLPCGHSTPVTLADKVLVRLRQAILSGELPPDSKISETELAQTYRVSRASLREAIARLESIKLVVRQANRGARVIPLSTRQFLELYRVREALEGMAAREAAEHMSEAELAELDALLDTHRSLLEDHKAYTEAGSDLDFHARIVQGSGNSWLIKLLCHDLYDLIQFYRIKYGNGAPRLRAAFDEHRQIVAALARRDGEMAELLMRHHIRCSREHCATGLSEG